MSKRIIILILIMFAVSCSKDKSDSILVGEWEATTFTTSVPVDENMDGIKDTDLKKEMDCVSMKARFLSNGKFSLESTNVTYDISIINGEVVLTPKGCGVEVETGVWSINQSSTMLYLEFTVDGKNESTPLDISINLSDDKLVFKDLFYDEDTQIITYTVEFKRT